MLLIGFFRISFAGCRLLRMLETMAAAAMIQIPLIFSSIG